MCGLFRSRRLKTHEGVYSFAAEHLHSRLSEIGLKAANQVDIVGTRRI